MPARLRILATPAPRAIRRGIDLTAGMALLVLTLPLFLVTALAIRLNGPGPVFRAEPHLREDGRTFLLLAFRSLTAGPTGGGAGLTGLGRLIEMIRLDQLPILLNLLRGDLTLIGPSPEPLTGRSRHVPENWAADAALPMKPGLSGWCAVN
ncbi:MAG TPA: sugar transferase [Roseomonas sp.]